MIKNVRNITWILGELMLADAEQFEDGTIEIFFENEQGQEGSTKIELADLAFVAKGRIEELESLFMASEDRENGMIAAINSLQGSDILMSKENPRGLTLESVLAKLQQEVQAKTKNIAQDQSELALYVRDNNKAILHLLAKAQSLQEDSYRELAKKAPDAGAFGRHRIG